MLKDYDNSYFNSIYFKEKDNSQRNQLRLREILSYKKTGKLLEIGCGLGGFARMAREHFDVECFDFSDYAITSLRKVPGIKAIQGDIETAVLPTNMYDVVVAFNVLEHLSIPGNTIKKIRDCLVEGGILFGSIPNNHGFFGKILTRISVYVDGTHCSAYPLHKWKSLFTVNFGRSELLGETPIGKNFSIYNRNKSWDQFSTNAIFICTK
jgi:2-polyprenyl-3-methyl-5-hydroxy-6-metoxy-1,4-benzoquinol methylase